MFTPKEIWEIQCHEWIVGIMLMSMGIVEMAQFKVLDVGYASCLRHDVHIPGCDYCEWAEELVRRRPYGPY